VEKQLPREVHNHLLAHDSARKMIEPSMKALEIAGATPATANKIVCFERCFE